LADYEQLFRRVLLNIRIHNTDDHLRNHGFFVDKQGVRLSPVYDINPFVDRNENSLAIDETDATCDVAVAMNAIRPMEFLKPRRTPLLNLWIRLWRVGGLKPRDLESLRLSKT